MDLHGMDHEGKKMDTEYLTQTSISPQLRNIGIYLVVTSLLLLGGCAALNHKASLPNDHPIEELLEDLIEEHTGLDIDLTPGD